MANAARDNVRSQLKIAELPQTHRKCDTHGTARRDDKKWTISASQYEHRRHLVCMQRVPHSQCCTSTTPLSMRLASGERLTTFRDPEQIRAHNSDVGQHRQHPGAAMETCNNLAPPWSRNDSPVKLADSNQPSCSTKVLCQFVHHSALFVTLILW